MTRPWRLLLRSCVILAVAAGGYGVWRWPHAIPEALFGPPAQRIDITVSGNIEAHQSVLSFTQVQAPIVALAFDEGAAVLGGAVLARVDDSVYQHQVAIDRANLAVATAQVAVNESNLAAVRSTVAGDRSDLSQKQRDYARAEELAKTIAGTLQAREQAQTAMRQAEAMLARDQSMVEAAISNVALARANEEALSAKLALDEAILNYTTLRAPFDGVIAVRQAELGQLAGPGVGIFTLDDLDHVWVRAYVNGPDLGRVRLDQAADVTTDTYPGKTYRGRISFISPRAEFTPKTVETHAERVTLVYRIKIDIDNPTHELLPGMPADARIAALPAGP